MKGFVEIEDILNEMINNIPSKCVLEYRLISATEFLRRNTDVLRNINANQVGQVLQKLGYKQEIKKVNGKTMRGYLLPCHVYNN